MKIIIVNIHVPSFIVMTLKVESSHSFGFGIRAEDSTVLYAHNELMGGGRHTQKCEYLFLIICRTDVFYKICVSPRDACD